MTTDRGAEYLAGLVRELCKLPHETEWVEFKVNNADPNEAVEDRMLVVRDPSVGTRSRSYLPY